MYLFHVVNESFNLQLEVHVHLLHFLNFFLMFLIHPPHLIGSSTVLHGGVAVILLFLFQLKSAQCVSHKVQVSIIKINSKNIKKIDKAVHVVLWSRLPAEVHPQHVVYNLILTLNPACLVCLIQFNCGTILPQHQFLFCFCFVIVLVCFFYFTLDVYESLLKCFFTCQ